MTGPHQAPDSFGTELEEWIRAVPGPVDVPAESVRQRIGRIARQFDRVLSVVGDANGLSVGDWEALSTLARSARDEGLTPGRMAELLGVTSGTISVRIGRLSKAGLVAPVGGDDGRRRPVRLTPAGEQAWGRATLARTELESRLVREALPPDDVTRLDALLGRLLRRLEDEFGPAPRHDMTRGGRPRS